MKKNIFILLVIAIFVIFVGIIVLKNAKEAKLIVDNTYNMFSGDVDAGVGYLFESKEYGRMNQSSQIEKMGKLLELYQDTGIIVNLYYDESSEAYTFSYGEDYFKSGLHIVSLREMDPMMN